MKDFAGLFGALLLVMALAACSPPVDESLLPTPVPTLPAGGLTVATPVQTLSDAAGAGAGAPETNVEEGGAATASLDDAASEAASGETHAPGAEVESEVDDKTGQDEGAAKSAADGTSTPATEAVADGAESASDVASVEVESPSAGDADRRAAAAEDDEGDEHAGAQAEATPEPNEAVEEEAEVSTDGSAEEAGDAYAGLPEEIVDRLGAADPARGEHLTVQNACSACHALDPKQVMAGPTWYNLAEVAATRVDGESAGHYLYNSIVAPNDYLVEDYAPGIMIQTYGETLGDQDLADIIAYLLTLRGTE